MWMQNNRARWDDIVDIDINGSDPNWDPLSWKLEWSGTNGFSHVVPQFMDVVFFCPGF